MKSFNLHDVKMNVVETATNGVVNEQTIFHFYQKNDVVSAKYSGGKVEKGFLAGTIDTNNTLKFKYAQKPLEGKIVGGESVCEITLNNEDKIEFTEYFEWGFGRGKNIFRELEQYYTITEIMNIIEQFEGCSLPKEQWNHITHLIVGSWYCMNFNFDTALTKMRVRIISYNEAVGTINSDTSGYHETITRFWLLVIFKYIEDAESNNTGILINSFLNSKYAKKDYIFNYYSKEQLFSKRARLTWIASKKLI